MLKTSADMYEQYRSARGIVAVDKEDLLEIDASSSQQVCRTFGVNKHLSVLRDLYNDNDLQFFANVGANATSNNQIPLARRYEGK